MKRIFCIFRQRSKFKAQGKQKESERVIGEIIRRQTSEVESDVWDHVPIALPPLAPSRLENCSLIDISYVLEVRYPPHVRANSLDGTLKRLIEALRNAFKVIIGTCGALNVMKMYCKLFTFVMFALRKSFLDWKFNDNNITEMMTSSRHSPNLSC